MIDTDKMRALAARLRDESSPTNGGRNVAREVIKEAADAIDLLLAEVEAANRELELSKLRVMGSNAAVESITKLVDKLRAELEAAAADKRDAERYRFLREAPDDFDVLYWKSTGWATTSRDALDAAIDALAQRQGEGS